MSINLHHVGSTLTKLYRPAMEAEEPEFSISQDLSSSKRMMKDRAPKVPLRTGYGHGPQRFFERARRAKADNDQTIVIFLAFSGARRDGDIHERLDY